MTMGASQTKRILFFAERFPPDLGGVAQSAFRTAKQIAELGWQVHVLTWTKTLQPGVLDSRTSHGSTEGLNLHRLGLFSNLDLSMQHTTNVLEWLHEQHEFTAAWGHYLYPAGYMAVVFSESVGIASTVSARGNDIDRLMFPPGDFARLMWTLERATSISSVSEDLAKKVRVLLDKNPEVDVLLNSVDTEVFRPSLAPEGVSQLRQELQIRPEEVVLGFCGELRHKKGLPFILSGFAEVSRSRPACLLIIGEVRPRERAHLTTFATENPVAADRILVTGRLEAPEAVARHLQICDVSMQPSVWDGLPNSVLESMACGRIVLASDAGGIPEVITHGEDGFLVPKAQLQHFGTALLEVLGISKAEKDRISVAARKKMTEQFNASQEGERLKQVLGKLVG